MNKNKKIEMIIFEVLEDKEWHSVSEMKCRIKEIDETLLLKENYIYVILKRLEKQKKLLDAKGNGVYRMKEFTNEILEKKDCREKVLNSWKKCYNDIMNIHQLSYEMSEEEFKEGKWIYELNKKIEDVIGSF